MILWVNLDVKDSVINNDEALAVMRSGHPDLFDCLYPPERYLAVFMSHHTRLGSGSIMRLLGEGLLRHLILTHI